MDKLRCPCCGYTGGDFTVATKTNGDLTRFVGWKCPACKIVLNDTSPVRSKYMVSNG
jgi:rubredoxin